jgi:hypothetical protein
MFATLEFESAPTKDDKGECEGDIDRPTGMKPYAGRPFPEEQAIEFETCSREKYKLVEKNLPAGGLWRPFKCSSRLPPGREGIDESYERY